MNLRLILKEWLTPLKTFVFEGKHSISNPLSLWKTIHVNFKLLPFNQARKLPIFIYRNTLIYEFGEMEITSSAISTGMVRWGRMNIKSPAKYGKIRNEGKITFKGFTKIGGSNILENSGHIIFGNEIGIAEGVTIMIRSKLILGDRTIISSRTYIHDSNDHFTLDVETKKVKRFTKDIIIGPDNWLCTGTFVKKGTITGPYTLVASGNTLLCKDYSALPPYSMLGGIPARVIGRGLRPIRNFSEEKRLKKYFREHRHINEIDIDIADKDIDNYCVSNLFRI